MYKRILPAVISFILLFSMFSTQASAGTPTVKTRGVWMWGSTLGSADSKTIVDKLTANYVNKVFLLVKGSAGTKTSSAALTDFVTAAHKAGVEVHFWYIVGDDDLYLTSHADAHIYHCPKPGTNLNPYKNTDTKVNLLYPGYKQYVLDNIKYFLQNYACDGIHLDVIRYTHLVYSFDTYQLAKAQSMGCDTARILNLFRNDYANMTGSGFQSLYTSGDPDVVKWITMRKNIIYDYINSVKDLISQVKPGIELSAAFMPEGAYDTDLADIYYAQNYAQNSPVLDEISPMAYFNSYGESPSWLKKVATSAISHVSNNCKISMGYQTFDNVTADQVKYQVQYALEGGAFGAVNFRYETTTDSQWVYIKDFYKKLYEATVPVELTSFSANVNSGNVNLVWSTATEKNNMGFEIQRKKTGSEYQRVGFINGKGTTTEAQYYSYCDKNLSAGNYCYRLKQVDYDGTCSYSQESEAELSIIGKFNIEQNYPNPFNPVTAIQYTIPDEVRVTLKIYNTLGETVATLINNELIEAGTHNLSFNASGLPSGVYMYSIQAGDYRQNKKMLLMK
jgi:uncharacterized lipoprotein YddW (UPF0748 family)